VQPIDVRKFRRVVVFTGAGMSAESGVPTYRGTGGVWTEYRPELVACQEAFEREPERVLDWHAKRRADVLACEPHAGHEHITALQQRVKMLVVVTQNIDGMHQRAGTVGPIELHGSLWRVRCTEHGVREDVAAGVAGGAYATRRCAEAGCGRWLRPDITWFGDMLNESVWMQAERVIRGCDLFVSVGTSGVVHPAAALPNFAAASGAMTVEVNPEPTAMSSVYDHCVRGPASSLAEVLAVG
jgi:NAD-dependent deacetylase